LAGSFFGGTLWDGGRILLHLPWRLDCLLTF
jgi:hypothetical protein